MASTSLIRGLVMHFKCRNKDYPTRNDTKLKRDSVPDDKVFWNIEWAEYSPPEYTSPQVLGKPWADPAISDSNFKPLWNSLDGCINRCSHHGPYTVLNNRPINPIGRTGLMGRGILGRWGPNHAADPIVTKWKRDEDNCVIHDEQSKRPILQFIAIKRSDCGEYAIPGGMVDPGEVISQTLKREFFEEALNSLEMEETEKDRVTEYLQDFFHTGIEVYRGYVDDVRNTDNAWMETVAQNFHDEMGDILDKVHLNAGDDANDVFWVDISKLLALYASHSHLIELVAEKYKAHW